MAKRKRLATKRVLAPNRIEAAILLLRGQRVMLDIDLAALYGVTTSALNQAVKRNQDRFPDDFMFQLSWDETQSVASSVRLKEPDDPKTSAISRSQTVILKLDGPGGAKDSKSQNVILKQGANPKFRPFAFTEQGIAMLSGLLKSPRAVLANIEIMRAYVRMREMLSTHRDFSKRLDNLEQKYDSQFKVVFQAIRELMAPPPPESKKRKRIGFNREHEE